MKFPANLREGVFLKRENRFLASVRCGGDVVHAHVANSGRMGELFVAGNRALLRPVENLAGRKTACDLVLVEAGGMLVSTDARMPNLLVRESIAHRKLVEFSGYETVTGEVRLAESRIDLMLSGAAGTCYIETKSVTLVEDGVALFPDAPTTRGRRHLLSLLHAVELGHRAAVVFVVQRGDARRFRPNGGADPEFCETLARVASRGVEVYAYTCDVTETFIAISGRVPLELGNPKDG